MGELQSPSQQLLPAASFGQEASESSKLECVDEAEVAVAAAAGGSRLRGAGVWLGISFAE